MKTCYSSGKSDTLFSLDPLPLWYDRLSRVLSRMSSDPDCSRRAVGESLVMRHTNNHPNLSDLDIQIVGQGSITDFIPGKMGSSPANRIPNPRLPRKPHELVWKGHFDQLTPPIQLFTLKSEADIGRLHWISEYGQEFDH